MSETKGAKSEVELLFIESGEAEQPFEWSIGKFGSRFLQELRDNRRMIGSKCPRCGKVYLPPRKVCGDCYVAMKDIVPVSNEGEIVAASIIRFGFIDPETGKQRPVPYGYVFVKPDGADTAISHFMEIHSPEDEQCIRIGQRVRAVYEEERSGSLLDIRCFEPVKWLPSDADAADTPT